MLQHEDDLTHFIKKQGLQPTEKSAVWACLGRLLNPKGSYCLTDDGLAANASLFFVGGYETTSNLITFAMLELAADQNLQVRSRCLLTLVVILSNCRHIWAVEGDVGLCTGV